jgi:hypothetical protein
VSINFFIFDSREVSMSKLTSFLMLFSLILFGIINVNAQTLIQDHNPNSAPAILQGSGGTVIDGDGDWFTFTSLPAGVSTSGSACAYLNGKAYHFGGSPGPSAEYQMWDEATDVWTSMGTMPGGARYYGSAETVAGKIYFIGGSQAWPTPTGMVEIFDGTTWTTGTPMPTPLKDIATGVYQDRYIYAVGGMIGGWVTYSDAVQVYDTQTDTWAAATNFPMQAGCMGGACVGNTIVVAGPYGDAGTQSNAIYEGEINASDPTIITWTLSTGTLRDAVYRCGGGAAAGMVFFTGGQSPYSNQALGYDPVTDVVTMFPNKPTPLGNIPNFVPGNNMMYVMGGYDGTYNLACEGMEYAMGPGPIFTDNFDSYIAGQQLACQTSNWTTWSNLPCDPTEDAYISSNYSYSGANSVVIVQNNDQVRLAGSLTSGKWYMSFLLYIPTGKAGYFNQLSGFAPNPNQWAVECYFDAGGAGRLVADVTTNFTWQENTWQQVVLIVDLDTHNAEFWFGDTDPLNMIYSWDWTRGGTINNQIDANDFFGATANDEMYMDNYYFGNAMPPIIPVELASFTASASEGLVELSWITATETNNQGFEVQRSSGGEFETIGFVEGNGTTTETHVYSYSDRNVNSGAYSYRLKQIDFDGTFAYSNVVKVEVPAAPLVFALDQNYPNPFNPSTTINFRLAEDSKVSLKVFDLLGQEVATLLNSNMAAGSHQVDFNASSLNSGVYLYKIEATGIDGTNFTNIKKMMLLK